MKILKLIFFPILIAVFIAGCETSDNPVKSPENSRQQSLSKKIQNNPLDQYIVVLKDNISRVPEVAADIAKQNTATIGMIYKNSIKGFSAKMTKAAAEKLKEDSRVKYIEIDRVFTLPPEPYSHGKKHSGGGTNSTQEPAQTIPWGITDIGGGVSAAGVGKTVWIIDTGVDTYFNNIELNIDLNRSANFVQRGKSTFQDGNGHGTHVAGIIAAKDNSIDVVGVAPGATVVAVRVLDNSGSGYYSWVIAGVDYVAGNASGGDVANMSLGGPYDKALNDAVIAAGKNGIKFAIAAGNDGQSALDYSPASALGSNIYTVSAYGDPNLFAWWSNYGDWPSFYSCPGVNILSLKKGGGTTTMSGTSMAAPHLAGLLLLGWSSSASPKVVNDPDNNPDIMAHL